MFRIKDKHFQVEEATLFFEIRELKEAKSMWGETNMGIGWFIEVMTQAVEIDEDTWQPGALCLFSPGPLSKWTDLEGVSVTMKDFFNAESLKLGGGGLYVFGRGKISDCRYSFGTRKENQFDFRWQGVSEIYSTEAGYETVDFEIATNIRFTTGTVYEIDSEKAYRMLGQFLDPRDFVQTEVNFYDNSVRPWGTVVYEPRVS